MAACKQDRLDQVEIHIDEQNFEEVEAVLSALRDDSRIANVSLYVPL